MKSLKALKNKKGFTLIELLTVIAILGILILIAAPKFLGYTTQAKYVQAKADIKSFENIISAELIEDKDLINSWHKIESSELEGYRDSNSLFTVKGGVESDYQFNESYIDIPEEYFKKEFKSELSGNFIMDSGGKIYYHDEKLAGNVNNSGSDEVREDGITVLKDGSGVKLANGDFIPAVTEEDFTLGAKVAGFYTYTGTEKKVYIPSDLKLGGNLITDASHLFRDSSVEKVVLLENNITIMSYMFSGSQAEELDLIDFNTSNVLNMRYMFNKSNAKILDLTSFDTSNSTDMRSMFRESKATSIDLSSFNTSKVTNLSSMFRDSNVEVIDLSKFDTTKNFDFIGIFQNAKATTGYARTQREVTAFNKTNKPSWLTFTLKQ